MALIGYAGASTFEQTLDPQRRELQAAGCDTIHEEHASGADRTRPALGRLLATIKPGDTLVMVRLDRLARSLVHLLQVIDLLKAKDAHFRSLGDPIDTTTPQGTFSLQVMGAVAELERALICERTKAGLRSARDQGRIGGNPALLAIVAGMRHADPELTLAGIATRLEQMRERTLRGNGKWFPSTVRLLLQRAEKMGMIGGVGEG